MTSSRHLSTILNRSPQPQIQQKRPGLLPAFCSLRMAWAVKPSYFASARFGGLAGHDLISVS